MTKSPTSSHSIDSRFEISKRVLKALPLAAALVVSAHGSLSEAKEVRYKDYPLEFKEGERLVLIGLRGSVRLTSAAAGKPSVLRARKNLSDKAGAEEQARFDALSFAVRKDGPTWIIEAKGPDAKSSYAAWMKPGAPELSIEIEAMPVPVEIFWREGLVAAQNWKQPISAGVVNGTIRTSGTEGQLRVQSQRGEIRIENHQGPAEVDSYGAKLSMQDVEGDVQLTNFGGESSMTGIKGAIDVKSNAGASTLAKSSGSLEFLAGRAPLTVNGFEGPLRGQTDQGTVIAEITGEADVNIESNQGTVSVRMPQDSGASVKFQTEEGQILVPETVRAPSAVAKVVTARLGGAGPKGAVAVKSKTGTIRLR